MTVKKTKTERQIPLERIRNIGIIAHIDAGKTTTTERVLYYTGKTYKLGDIDEGTTQMDWMEQEKERGITIVSAATTTMWTPKLPEALFSGPHRINIIDTPGHVDFTAEVERSLRVLDGGITVLDAEEGVQSQSETVWHQADKYSVPRICFINKMDKLGANFDRTVGDIEEKLGVKTAVLAIPIGVEQSFKGIVLLLERQAIIWEGDETGAEYSIQEVPPELKAKVEEARHRVIERIAETDEKLTEKYISDEEPSVQELKQALRRATIKNELVPVFCGSSLRNKGVQPLLDAVVDFLPSPLDLEPEKGVNPKTGAEEERKPDPNEPFSALAFKVQTDPHVGRLTYIRIYSGHLAAGSYATNITKREQERIGRLLLMHANQREEIEDAEAGEIVAVVGAGKTTTGDTLSDSAHPILFEGIEFTEPVIALAIEPKTRQDQERMGTALAKLAEEDPTFKIKVHPETGQTIVSGMGELHLEIIVDRLKREFKVETNTGNPQVAYKETIRQTTEAEGKYIRQSGGRGQYGHCFLRVEPKNRGEGYEFENKVVGGKIPREFIPAVEKGVKEAMENGVIGGYPLVDMKVTLYDGTYHEVDSSEIAFKIAGSMALQTAVKQASPVLLEPIMKVEVTVPEEFMGDVIGDLSSKRAHIVGTTQRGKVRIIHALAPLAELSRYATILRSMTQGRASYYMEPSHYEEVPANIQEALLSKGKTGKETQAKK
ncbi:MAG: translation elongation factor G [Candidatus Chisholmbacteria bacterium RIFCSPLOWO2_01_FULL_50_28]|uniref:Elongation factor G n=1 Tax=Candidatus Chisholmbacteria bacterium RIFCSPHIGHO2_01_FULL_52_32 TaxID=1797591 RepID=A0A1G1VTV1_9BACT|nr:MAG: translation elongation factor G [Candidatus Chisholmbacteria bacterium RIFCSPHIGHO2_01_FULL_52_32]OGY19776.1 MAG: translation elongation factor G [Candidatus Chisholmbacteria bacterium RIFCSPLOWO2_01_FULL_50_28]